MSEYIVELPDGSAADEFVAKMGVEDCRIYEYRLTGEIVRCRDCKHSDEIRVSYSEEPDYQCLADWCQGVDGDSPLVEPDGFCAWGERRKS